LSTYPVLAVNAIVMGTNCLPFVNWNAIFVIDLLILGDVLKVGPNVPRFLVNCNGHVHDVSPTDQL